VGGGGYDGPSQQKQQQQQQSSLAGLIAGVAKATGAPLEEVVAALDPRLLRLKRLALAIAQNVDFSRLHKHSSWPPTARAQWAHTLLTSTSLASLLSTLGVFEKALRADDLAAAGGTFFPLPSAFLPPWYHICVPSITAALAVPTVAAITLRLQALQRALAPCSLSKVFHV
jgi:hypothetical protein